MQLLYLVVLLLTWIPGTVAHAQEDLTAGGALPIHIEADRMESYEKKDEVVFAGRVEARQGAMIIQADRMTVSYLSAAPQPAADKSQRVKKVRAEGNVKVTQEDWVATGQELDYFARERKAVLSGGAKVWQGNNMVTGQRIVLYLDEGKTIVEGGVSADVTDRASSSDGERVKAYIYPESERQGAE